MALKSFSAVSACWPLVHLKWHWSHRCLVAEQNQLFEIQFGQLGTLPTAGMPSTGLLHSILHQLCSALAIKISKTFVSFLATLFCFLFVVNCSN